MPTKLYCGNVPPTVSSTELKELFEKYGKVLECDIIKDYGFIHMEDASKAKAAIAALNDFNLKGTRIKVEMSTTQTRKGERSQKRIPSSMGSSPPPSMSMRSSRDYPMMPVHRNGYGSDRFSMRSIDRYQPYDHPYVRRGGDHRSLGPSMSYGDPYLRDPYRDDYYRALAASDLHRSMRYDYHGSYPSGPYPLPQSSSSSRSRYASPPSSDRFPSDRMNGRQRYQSPPPRRSSSSRQSKTSRSRR
ncbi:unnamed protein product [Didymodactylos carnosus]|uniref:RRM domain-containing protein n=1 Tax=Didymodactylos carnosus TaxID=1234261 RepID=A0A813NNQ8_9BILA|nr:unnamed protein product [Didymodactylos carnosus]CAF0742359.1 unnamed protein product [Didymodactylos carnosus]CAF3519165.1 unnamed protein product [Didymodactylos carnosus]CAF3520841.1 unnamed protein product [Didymodactylos carnosus]